MIPEIGRFILKIVESVCLFRYNRTVVPEQGYSKTNRVARFSNISIPNSQITETPVRH